MEGDDSCIHSKYGCCTFDNSCDLTREHKENKIEYPVEKPSEEVISNLAIGGLYYWKKGSNFVKYGNKMIERNERVNGEFYIAPVFDRFINKGHRVGIDRNTRHDIMGTPEDLEKLK